MLTKKMIALALAIAATIAVTAQQLPWLAYDNYEGWFYSGGPITSSSFSRGMSLYVTTMGNALYLTSPEFPCNDIDSIAVVVKGKAQGNGSTLTTVIETPDGLPLDSVMTQSSTASATQVLSYAIAVPHGMTTATLRFTSWDGVITSFIAIKAIELTAITSSTPPPAVIPGDVDGNGSTTIADVTTLIDYLLSGTGDISQTAADVDSDGNVSISDVTALIDKLLAGDL